MADSTRNIPPPRSTPHGAQPEKELRFTRNRQGTHLLLAAVLTASLALLLTTVTLIIQGPHLLLQAPRIIAIVLLTLASLLLAKLAHRCIRHAYIILTPLGVEILPLFKVDKDMTILYWQEIHHHERTAHTLTLHRNAEESSGIHLTLKPIAPHQRALLHQAIDARINHPS